MLLQIHPHDALELANRMILESEARYHAAERRSLALGAPRNHSDRDRGGSHFSIGIVQQVKHAILGSNAHGVDAPAEG